MTIPYCIQVESTDKAVEEVILSTFSEIHAIYNNWNPASEISQLNQLPAYQKVALSPQLASFLSFVDQMVIQTEGRFDPTVEPLQLLWKHSLQLGQLPSPQDLEKLSPAIGWEKVHLENDLFWKEHPLTAIDLGGIAKGYAVDLLAERLAQLGLRNIYIEWGGEVRTIGPHPEGRPWKVGIQGLSTIDLTNTAIATSGSYMQHWTLDNISYTHIIDPRTQKPLHDSPITSVSVLAPTCAEADAYATALMLFPTKEEALSWAQERNITLFIW